MASNDDMTGFGRSNRIDQAKVDQGKGGHRTTFTSRLTEPTEGSDGFGSASNFRREEELRRDTNREMHERRGKNRQMRLLFRKAVRSGDTQTAAALARSGWSGRSGIGMKEAGDDLVGSGDVVKQRRVGLEGKAAEEGQLTPDQIALHKDLADNFDIHTPEERESFYRSNPDAQTAAERRRVLEDIRNEPRRDQPEKIAEDLPGKEGKVPPIRDIESEQKEKGGKKVPSPMGEVKTPALDVQEEKGIDGAKGVRGEKGQIPLEREGEQGVALVDEFIRKAQERESKSSVEGSRALDLAKRGIMAEEEGKIPKSDLEEKRKDLMERLGKASAAGGSTYEAQLKEQLAKAFPQPGESAMPEGSTIKDYQARMRDIVSNRTSTRRNALMRDLREEMVDKGIVTKEQFNKEGVRLRNRVAADYNVEKYEKQQKAREGQKATLFDRSGKDPREVSADWAKTGGISDKGFQPFTGDLWNMEKTGQPKKQPGDINYYPSFKDQQKAELNRQKGMGGSLRGEVRAEHKLVNQYIDRAMFANQISNEYANQYKADIAELFSTYDGMKVSEGKDNVAKPPSEEEMEIDPMALNNWVHEITKQKAEMNRAGTPTLDRIEIERRQQLIQKDLDKVQGTLKSLNQ